MSRNTDKSLVGFEVAKMAYKNGFHIHTNGHYFNNQSQNVKDLYCYQRPTKSQLKDWLMFNHNIIVSVYPIEMYKNDKVIEQTSISSIEFSFNVMVNGINIFVTKDHLYNDYYDAFENALVMGLGLIAE